jgi:hypothetical protein
MFAVKSMDLNYNRLKLKLEMVYRGMTVAEAKSKFNEAGPPPPVVVEVKPARRRIKEVKPSPVKG